MSAPDLSVDDRQQYLSLLEQIVGPEGRSAGERVLRLTPPLTITDDELEHAIAVLEDVLR